MSDSIREGNLHNWFSKSKSKDGKPGWVQSDGSPCANEKGETKTPKCYSSQRLAGLKKSKEGKSKIRSADARKSREDSGQQQKSGGASPTNVRTFTDPKDYKKHNKPKKMKKEQFSNWRDNTPEPMVNELFGLGKKKENKNRGAGGSWETSTAEARARSRGWKDPNEKPKPMSPFGPEKGTSKSPDKFKNVKKTLGIRPKPEPKATSQTKPEPKATSQTKTDPTPKSNPYSGKDKLKPQSFSTAVRSGTKMNKSTPSAPGKIVTQQGNQKEQFSNWRDNYVATEHEFIDLIKPEPMVGISEEDKKGSGSGKKDACYKKVKASASVWPSAYASGRLVQCRKKGADNYGNSTKNEEWKPDPTEKRQKKAAKLGREEDIEKGKSKKYGRDEDKIKDLYKRRMAVDFKKKKSSIGEERLEELKCWKGYKRKKGSTPGAPGSCVKEGFTNWRDDLSLMEGVSAWQRKEGKNKAGGLNEKGRKSYERENPGSDLKAPQPEGGSRKKSFCARMGGMKKKLTSSKTANDPDSRINKSLRKWNC